MLAKILKNIMEILIHLLLGLGSVSAATAAAVKPTAKSFLATYVLSAGAVITGVILLVMNPGHFESVCVSGLFYIGSITTLLRIGRRKMSRIAIKN